MDMGGFSDMLSGYGFSESGMTIDTSSLFNESIPFFSDTSEYQTNTGSNIDTIASSFVGANSIPDDLGSIETILGDSKTRNAEDLSKIATEIHDVHETVKTKLDASKSIGIYMDGTQVGKVVAPYVDTNLGQTVIIDSRDIQGGYATPAF